MGLFNKKYCDICGEKIGLLGNRKLEDGNICSNCADKLSPLFNERRNSTLDEIKNQLEYRELNRQALDQFTPSRKFGDYWKIWIDDSKQAFILSTNKDYLRENPDIIPLANVTSCELKVDHFTTEERFMNDHGEYVSHHPERYRTEYDFYIDMEVNHPYISTIRMKLNPFTVDVMTEIHHIGLFERVEDYLHPEYNPHYQHYYHMGEEIVQTLMTRTAAPNTAPVNTTVVSSNMDQWICPNCSSSNNAGKFCQNCGTQKPQETVKSCSNCGWQPLSGQTAGKFCPECGTPLT